MSSGKLVSEVPERGKTRLNGFVHIIIGHLCGAKENTLGRNQDAAIEHMKKKRPGSGHVVRAHRQNGITIG